MPSLTNASTRADTPQVESVRRRYLATMSAQFVRLAAAVATAGIVPRALGPANFGNYNFLMTTSSSFRNFLQPSAQQAFFTFSSQERESGGLTKLYTLTLVVQLMIVMGFIAAAGLFRRLDWLWAGQSLNQIVLVTVLEWMLFTASSLAQLGDSKGLTVRVQVLTLLTSLINAIGVVVLYAVGVLNMYSYVAVNMLAAATIIALLIRWLLIRNAQLTWFGGLRTHAREYLQRWWRFAAPLLLLEYYTPLVAYLSVYLLQRWYGSIEQGYFSLAFKWSALVLVFTSSALNIFWREIANATGTGNQERAAAVYIKFTRLLFFLAAALCTWLSFGSRLLVVILAGSEYKLAAPILAVMAFYPLQQTYGQINTAALEGSEQTRAVRNLGIIVSVPDLLLSYFLLASPSAPIPGLGLGAMGVAIRMVVFGLMFVQAYEWMSHRVFGLNYLVTLGQKLAVMIVILASGFISMAVLGSLLERLRIPAPLSLGFSSLVYAVMIGACALLSPQLMGVTRSELNENIGNAVLFATRLFARGQA